MYNGSFEDYTTCPPSNGHVENCVGWFNASASPDYCNACTPLLSGVSVPSNTYGYQQPYDGNAYMGGVAYVQGYEYRECIRGTLIEPLVVGTKYYVSFKVSLAENQSNCGSNKIGVLFANDQYTDASTLALNLNYAHVYTNTIITDTENFSRGWCYHQPLLTNHIKYPCNSLKTETSFPLFHKSHNC